TNEVDVIAFKVAPVPLAGQSIPTWKSYFERFNIVVNTVYDVCDVLPNVLQAVSPLHKLSLVACVQDPQDEATSDETTALLYFDIQNFNKLLLPPGCTQSVAEEMEQLMNRDFADRKLVTVSVQDGVKKLWGYTIRTEMKSSFTSDDLKVQLGDPILKASFETRNDFIKRWLVDDALPKPLTLCFERFSVHWGLNYYEMYFKVHFDVEEIADKDQANFELELAKIAGGPASKEPYPGDISYVNWLDTWNKLDRTVFSKGHVKMISHVCTRFEKINATVLHIEGSVLVNNLPSRLDYERSNRVTRSQLEGILVSPTSGVPPPISIQMSDFGWTAYPFAVQEVYYDLRGLSKEPDQSGASAMTAKLLSSLSTASDGFSVGTQITEKIEQCLLSRPPVQRFEHLLKVPLLLDGKAVTWTTPPAENSEEYSQFKQNVNQYLQDVINAGNLRKVITAFQVGKLARDALAFYYYHDVHVHLRLIYDALAVGQQLSLSETATNVVNKAKLWLEKEYSSALETLPKSGVHLGKREKSHLAEINEPIVCGYIYHHPDESMKGPGNLLTTGVPEPPLVRVFPTSAVKPQSETTVPTPTTTADNDISVPSIDSIEPAVVDEQLPETSKNEEAPEENIDSVVVTEKSQTDTAPQSEVVVSQNQSASNGAGAGDSLAAKTPAPPGSVTRSTIVETTLPQAEPNKEMLTKAPEQDASRLLADSSDPLMSNVKQTGLNSDEETSKPLEIDPNLSESVGSGIKEEASPPTTVPKALGDDSRSQLSESDTIKYSGKESPILSNSVTPDADLVRTASPAQPSTPDNLVTSQALTVNTLQKIPLGLKLNSSYNSTSPDGKQAGPSPVVVSLLPKGSAHTHTSLNKPLMIMAAFTSFHALHGLTRSR
ncbi:hypothetical protein CSKR_100690, partial [Clonorchis sinensis]